MSCSAGDEGADGSVSVTLVSDAPDRVDLVADGGRVTLETLLVRVAVGVVLMFPSLVGGVEGEGTSAIVVVVVVFIFLEFGTIGTDVANFAAVVAGGLLLPFVLALVLFAFSFLGKSNTGFIRCWRIRFPTLVFIDQVIGQNKVLRVVVVSFSEGILQLF